MDNKQGVQQVMHQVQLNPAPSPSVSSSPSHEFSFTISLQTTAMTATPMKFPEKNNKKQSSFAIDLSPADEIFSDGHLLPLHLLSHVPVSPRSSINSLDSFTLPIHELSQHTTATNNSSSMATVDDQYTSTDHCKSVNNTEEKGRRKLRFFSFLGWRKSRETEEGKSGNSKFDIREVAKRYMKLVKPFLAMVMKQRQRNGQLHRRRQSYSFSGNLMMRRSKEELHSRGRKQEYSSAPSSMMTSRTNSGLLMGSGSGSVTPTKSDSTMEELQAAIQAAIAHCKNTLASDHQINLP